MFKRRNETRRWNEQYAHGRHGDCGTYHPTEIIASRCDGCNAAWFQAFGTSRPQCLSTLPQWVRQMPLPLHLQVPPGMVPVMPVMPVEVITPEAQARAAYDQAHQDAVDRTNKSPFRTCGVNHMTISTSLNCKKCAQVRRGIMALDLEWQKAQAEYMRRTAA